MSTIENIKGLDEIGICEEIKFLDENMIIRVVVL